MSVPTALEIRVHLEDGRTYRFAQPNPYLSGQVIDHIQPTRLFSNPQLVFGSGHSLTAFPSRLIARVEFITDELNWPFHSNANNIQEVTEEQFRQKTLNLTVPIVLPNNELMVFAELELVNGQRIFAEVTVVQGEQARLPIEQAIFLNQLLSSNGLIMRRRDVGYSIINPSSLVRLSLYPGPAELPPNAWQMDVVRD